MNNFGALYFIYVIFRGGQLRKWIIRIVGSAYRNKKPMSPKQKTARKTERLPPKGFSPQLTSHERSREYKTGQKG